MRYYGVSVTSRSGGNVRVGVTGITDVEERLWRCI